MVLRNTKYTEVRSLNLGYAVRMVLLRMDLNNNRDSRYVVADVPINDSLCTVV